MRVRGTTGEDGNRMKEKLSDCTWCGSRGSIEFGICQVCLMEYPIETKVIRLPLERAEKRSPVIRLDEDAEVGVAE